MKGPPWSTLSRWRRVLRTAPWWIAIFGALARVAAWSGGRSLWLDESYIGANLVDLDWAQLMGALRDDQSAPPLWLILEKALGSLLSMDERILRIPALLGGIAVLFIAIPLARRVLRPAAVPVAVLLLAVSPAAVYFSQDLKPYSTDLAVTALLLLWGMRLAERVPAWKGCLALIVGGAFTQWFSFPAVFTLAGVGVVALATALRRRDAGGALRLVVVGVAWVASLGGLYVFTVASATANDFLQDFWSAAFPPVHAGVMRVASWSWSTGASLYSEAVGFRFAALAAPLAVVGAVVLARRNPVRFAVLMGPLVFVLAAATVRLYPVSGRVALFLLPCLLLPLAEGIVSVRWRVTSAARVAVAAVLLVLIVAWPLANTVASAVQPPKRQEIKPLLLHLKARLQPGDVVYLHYGSLPAWRFYRSSTGLADVEPHIGPRAHYDPSVHEDDVRTLIGRKRVWIVLSHWWWHDAGDEYAGLVGALEKHGTRLSKEKWPGTELLLFDLANRPEAPRETAPR